MYSIRQNLQSFSQEEVVFFMESISKLHSHHVHQELIETIASMTLRGQVRFQIANKRFSDSQEGVYRTYKQRSNRQKSSGLGQNVRHVVIIKKNTENVIIHEIAHAIEKTLEPCLIKEFENRILRDLHKLPRAQFVLKEAISKLLVEELRSYPAKQRVSELFARYFEIHCQSKESDPKNSIPIKDFYLFFEETNTWREHRLFPLLRKEKIIKGILDATDAKPDIDILKPKTLWTKRNPSMFS